MDSRNNSGKILICRVSLTEMKALLATFRVVVGTLCLLSSPGRLESLRMFTYLSLQSASAILFADSKMRSRKYDGQLSTYLCSFAFA